MHKSPKTIKKLRLILGWFLVFFLFFQCASFGQPATAQEYFNKASMQYLGGDLDGALENLQAALKIEPNHAGALELMKSITAEKKVAPAPAVQTPSAPIAGSPAANAPYGPYEAAMGILFGFGFFSLLAALLVFLRHRVKIAFARDEDKLYCPSCFTRILPHMEQCPKCGMRTSIKIWNEATKEQKMWYAKIGWIKNPFTLDMHPELFTGYKNEVRQILEKVNTKSGHILVYGPLGAGKSTLLRWLAMTLSREYRAIYIPRPPLNFEQLIRFIVQSMGFPANKAASYDLYHLDQLRRKIGKHMVLLLDEAHEFTLEIERPLRTLGDLDGINLVMGGLPETINKIKTEALPLYERLALEVELTSLLFEDFKELLKLRIENAKGAGLHPFTASAIEKIYEISKGNPRTALKLCDRAVTLAINRGEDKIGPELIMPQIENSAQNSANQPAP